MNKIYYHITFRDKLPSILEAGIKFGDASGLGKVADESIVSHSQRKVFFFHRLNRAQDIAQEIMAGDIVILEVNLEGFKITKDELYGDVFITSTVPPNRIIHIIETD